jgi:hypothetical protein
MLEGIIEHPTNDEIENCRRTTLRYIHQYNPKLVVLLGNSAVTSVIGSRWKKELGGISKWRGWQIPDQDLNTWICPTYHPSFVERSDSADIDSIWIRDLREAFSLLEKPFLKHKEPYVEYPPDLRVLDRIKDGVISFDYETTGKKPMQEDINCSSICSRFPRSLLCISFSKNSIGMETLHPVTI